MYNHNKNMQFKKILIGYRIYPKIAVIKSIRENNKLLYSIIIFKPLSFDQCMISLNHFPICLGNGTHNTLVHYHSEPLEKRIQGL